MACNVYVIPMELFIDRQPILKEMDACELRGVHTQDCVHTLHKAHSHTVQFTFALSICVAVVSVLSLRVLCVCTCISSKD